MEFVGQSVKKEFQGLGILVGVVNSFDSSSGLFEIVYEDGASEEVDFAEVTLLLKGEVELVRNELIEKFQGGGRRPKKRRREEEAKSESPGSSGNSPGRVVRNCCSREGFGETQLKDGVIDREFVESLEGECGNLKESVCVNGIDGGNPNVDLEDNLKKTVDFDTNGALDGDSRGVEYVGSAEEAQKVECCFDGNLKESVFVNGIDGGNPNTGLKDNLKKTVDYDTNVALYGASSGCESVGSAEEAQKVECCFDWHLRGNGSLDGTMRVGECVGYAEETRMEQCCFDGNLQADGNGTIDGALREGESVDSAEKTQKEECGFDVDLSSRDKMEVVNTNSGEDLIECTSTSHVNESDIDGKCEKIASLCAVEAVEVTPTKDSMSNGGQQEDTYFGSVEETPVKDGRSSCDQVIEEACLGIVEAIQKEDGEENIHKKRRRLSENLKSTTERVSRRSNRRMTSTFSCQNHVSSTEKSQAANNVTSTPAVNTVLDREPFGSRAEGYEEKTDFQHKLELSPSSKNLNLDGIPVIDVFSIYACLRSFSTTLFLSPFSLEAFVEALRCSFANSLIDFIHCSILHTLKMHLEFLSNEGSESAIVCLRSLNWGLLDLITWPVFMVEYLLTHGPELKPGFDLCRLTILNGDYYKLPVAVKVELLRCLCDDVIEVEAIRSELNRRTLRAEVDMDIDRTLKIEKKKKDLVDDLGGSCLIQEKVDETTDWNSDECCLCKMDGSLICCDGCPAAYHLRCVGVTNDLLPEGEWYCPECVIDKREPWMNSPKSLRGAELLGVDPHGRLYFSSCGYLLVLNSYDRESSYSYYHRNDFNAVLDMLKSSDILCSGVINAISIHWNIPVDPTGVKGQLDSQNHIVCQDMVLEGQFSAIHVSSLPVPISGINEVKDVLIDERKSNDDSVIAEDFGHESCKVSESNKLDSIHGSQFSEMANQYASCEGSFEISQAPISVQISQKTGADCLSKSYKTSNESGMPEKPGHTSLMVSPRKRETSHLLIETDYINHYSFARTAASVADELTRKSSDGMNKDPKMSSEEIISAQLKVVAKKSTSFFWPYIQKLNVDEQKEDCGWCFSCKSPTDSGDCLFNINDKKPENLKSAVLGVCSKKCRKSHLVAVIYHILSIEDRLCGLLLGPWQNPHYTKLLCKRVLKSSDVSSVKQLILTLEANLRRIALLPEWMKQVDSVGSMGSASHVSISPVNVSTKHGLGRKRGRFSDPDSSSSPNASTRSGIFWWRGGRLSRQLFHWKVLPHSLASKCGRQAGCTKIPGVLYPEGSEFAKRSKYVAWQAAVETSTITPQLAFLVRELDLNIRWDDLDKTRFFFQLEKESRNLARPFKKVIIRRKCIEGADIKYLLDFGKRKNIPDSVIRHGTMFEASSSERKKYWLDESHVPLYLLKSFEEKKLAQKSNKMNSEKLPVEASTVTKKHSRKEGLSYLLSKGEKSENCLCGHCKKVMLIREAVSCQSCEGLFHIRHVRKFKGSVTADCMYTCHKCHNEKLMKMKVEKGKVRSQKGKKASPDSKLVRSGNCKRASTVQSKSSKNTSTNGRTTRSQYKPKVSTVGRPKRSVKKVKYVPLPSKKRGRRKKGKRVQSKRGVAMKSKKGICCYKKKRTRVYHAYWLNGILFSRKPNDERSVHFRERKAVLSNHLNDTLKEPKCRLCHEAGYLSALVYVGCEICEDWFHGDAFGINMDNISNIIGFRCHNCRKRNPPVCPHLPDVPNDEVQLLDTNNNSGCESVGDVCNVDQHPSDDPPCSFHMHDFVHQKQKVDTIPDSNQNLILDCKMEGEEGLLSFSKQKEDAILHYIDKEQKPDALTDSNQTLVLEECKSGSEKGNTIDVELFSRSGYSPSEYDEDVIELGVESLEHNKVEDGLVEMTALPEMLLDGTVPLQTTISSIEILDKGIKQSID